jgi:hypothetical protein
MTHPLLGADSARLAWTGSRYIDVTTPDPEDIVLDEVAVGLSREPRYGGNATAIPWSVGQHSIMAAMFARDDGVTSAEILLTILLHDAPEYMLRDMLRPVKSVCPDYRKLEEIWWHAVARKFRLPFDLPGIVKYYDDLACASEKAVLLSPETGEWPGLPSPRDIPSALLGSSSVKVSHWFMAEVGALLTVLGKIETE